MISGIGITDGLVPCSQQYWNNYKFSETIKINPRNQLKSKSNAFLPDTHFSTQTRWNEFQFNAQTQRLWGSLTEDSQSNSISDSYTLTHNETQWDQQLSLKSKSAIILEIEISNYPWNRNLTDWYRLTNTSIWNLPWADISHPLPPCQLKG